MQCLGQKMRRVLFYATSAALFGMVTLLLGIASRGQLPGYSWSQQFTLYLVLIGSTLGIAITTTALALMQKWYEKN